MQLITSAGMAASILPWILQRFLYKSRRVAHDRDIDASLADGSQQNDGECDLKALDNATSTALGRVDAGRIWRIIPLALSDLTVGILDTLSILFAAASLVSIVNCVMLVFSAVVTRLLLGTQYSRRQWVGVVMAVLGVLDVGVVALQSDSSASSMDWSSLIGVIMSLAARGLGSVQFAYEERFMKTGLFSPLAQVSAEGSIEVLLILFIGVPTMSLLNIHGGRWSDLKTVPSDLQAGPVAAWTCA